MIEYGDFSIELSRWGSAPSQLLPLWAIKNGYSLDTVVKLYSVSFILLYYLFFLCITVLLKNNNAGIALMLALCLGFRHAFYYASAELYQGMALAFVLWAILDREKEYSTVLKKWMNVIVSLILIFIISFYHQLAFFAVFFILIFLIIDKKRWTDKYLIVPLALSILWFFIRVFILTETNYEKGKIPGIDVFLTQIPNIFELPSWLYFKQFISDNSFSFTLTSSIAVLLFVKTKKWLLLVFFILYSIAYLVLILITYYQGESPLMYENYYVLPGCFFAVALIFLFKDLNKNYITLIALIILITVNCIGIYRGHYTLTKRVDYLTRLIKHGRTSEKRKFLVDHKNFPWHYTWVKWAVPFETAILSSLKSPDSTVTVYIPDHINQLDSLIHKENIFLGPDWALTWFGSNNLNKNYFKLPSSGYEKLNSFQGDTLFNESQFDSSNVMLMPEQDSYRADADSFMVVPINIINNSGLKIHSIADFPKAVFISYHILDKGGNMLLWDGRRTAFEVDIKEEYVQGVLVELPREKGDYFLEIDIVSEGIRWWNLNKRVALKIE